METTVKKVQVGLEEKADVISEKGLCVQSVVREEAKNIKDKLETTSQDVQGRIDRLDTSLKDLQIGLEGKTDVIGDKIQVLATTAQDIKDQLGEVHQSINRLHSSATDSPSVGGRLNSIILLIFVLFLQIQRYQLQFAAVAAPLAIYNPSTTSKKCTSFPRNPAIFFARHKSLQI